MMNVPNFILDYQTRWEGEMSRDPNDAGNWSSGVKGQGTLIGSNIGITATPLAAHRGVPVSKITMADMEKLTQKEASDIAISLYYNIGLQNLVWNPVTASIMDFGFNAGPARAMRLLQDLLDCKTIDGKIGAGGETANLFAEMCQTRGLEFMAGAWWSKREDYYEDLVVAKPSNGIYLNGWDNRSDYFTPGHKEGWWNRFVNAKG